MTARAAMRRPYPFSVTYGIDLLAKGHIRKIAYMTCRPDKRANDEDIFIKIAELPFYDGKAVVRSLCGKEPELPPGTG